MGGTPGIQAVDKIPALVRANFTLENHISFPAGGLSNQKPIINLSMTDYPATERVDSYFDIGATDASMDLDVIDTSVMRPLYLDPAFIDGNFETTGVLSPKAVLLRCLLGSGLVYVNAHPQLSPDVASMAPFALHANAGLFYYAFPKQIPHYSKAVDPADPTAIFTTAVALLSLHLRTFEAANRFQMLIFK